MRTRAFFLGLCLVAVGLVSPPGAAQAAEAGPTRIMVVGDSISQGSAGDWTWRYRLYKHLVGAGVNADMVGPRRDLFDNVANVQGATTYADPAFDADHDAVWGRAAVQAKDTIEAEVRAASPDVALILLGINDLAWFTDAPTAEQSLRAVITNARAANPSLKIVLGRVLPTDRAASEPEFAAKVTDLNQRITTIVSSMSTPQSPVVLAATDSGFTAATDTYDGVHPNAKGELKIAAAFADSLSTQLGVGTAYPRPLPTVTTGPLVAPALTATSGNGESLLSWTLSPGATGYYVWTRNVTEGEGWGRLPIPLQGPSWTAGLLRNGGVYEFKLETLKGRDTGVFSNVVTARPAGPSPAGTSLSVSSGDRQARLTWTGVANATDYWVWTRNVTEGQSWGRLPIPLGGTSWTAGALANGGVYEFKLQSRNGYQDGAFSNVVTARPTGPNPAGTSLSVTSGDRQARLTWTGVANATDYWVWTRNVTEGQSWGRLPIPLGGTSWTAGALANGGVYEFKLQSRNGYQDGSFSNVVTARPTGPNPSGTSLSVSSGDRQARLTWTDVNNATDYWVWTRNVTEGQAWGRLPIPLGGNAWTAGALTNGGVYEFKLQSRNGYQDGSFSNVVTARPTGPNPAGTSLSVSSGDRQARLTWTDVSNATDYWVWTRNVTEGQAWGRLPIPLGGNAWTAGALANGGVYEFKLQSRNGYQDGSFSNVVTARPSGPNPAGTSLSVSSGDRQARLTWSDVPNATDYWVWTRNVTEGEAWSRLPIPLGGNAWTAGALANGGTYEFKLQSRNGYQDGSFSNVVTARPTGPTPGSPTLSVTPANRGAHLSWGAVPNATAYYIYVKNLTMQETSFIKLPVPISGTSWDAGQMVAGASYEFKIRAMNGYIEGGTSNVVGVRPTGVAPAAPALSVSYSGSNVTLNWNSPANATHYEVYFKDLTTGQTSFQKTDMWVLLEESKFQPWLDWGETRQFYVVPMNGLIAGTPSNIVRARLTSSEYDDIATWMTGEINRNSTGTQAKEIRDKMNAVGCQTWDPNYGSCVSGMVAAGLLQFRNLVCTGCVWDHKPIIRDYWNDRDHYFADVNGSGRKVYYDIWSNIHFGFVGRASGIDRDTLIFGSHISEGAGNTDAGDDLSIDLGVALYDQYGRGGLTKAGLDSIIRSHLSDWVRLTGRVQVRAIDDFS